MLAIVLLWILMFMFLVLIHELGHFFAAKKTWVKVLEFGMGIPPKAFRWRKDKTWTEYTVNWIPLGWFVRLKGENPDDPETFNAADSFITASLWKKLVILFAWVTVNFITAWLLFSVAFMHGVTPISVVPENSLIAEAKSYMMPTRDFLSEQWLLSGSVDEVPVEILSLMDEWIGVDAWIQVWDIITSVWWIAVTNVSFSQTIKKFYGETFVLEVDRWWQMEAIDITCPQDTCILWVMIDAWWLQTYKPAKFTWFEAFAKGWYELRAQTSMTFRTLGNLFREGGIEKLSGPICIVRIGGNIATQWSDTWSVTMQWAFSFLAFAGMISLALAIFNILPIPALDWGRAVGVLIQHIFGLKPEKYFVIENYFNMTAFVLLMWLWIYIMLLDLQRCWWWDIPFI